MAIQMLVLSKEPQTQQADIEISIYIDDWIIANQCLCLQTELRCGRTEQRCVVSCVIAQVDTKLRIHSAKPTTMVIQIAVQGYIR